MFAQMTEYRQPVFSSKAVRFPARRRNQGLMTRKQLPGNIWGWKGVPVRAPAGIDQLDADQDGAPEPRKASEAQPRANGDIEHVI
jgi:hypothetical protein